MFVVSYWFWQELIRCRFLKDNHKLLSSLQYLAALVVYCARHFLVVSEEVFRRLGV
jgi:hypothetical protein